MAPIPIALGSRGRICLQPARRFARELAAATDGDQEGTLDVRHFRDAEVIWGLRDRLRAGPGAGEREVRRVVTRYPQQVWRKARQRDEGDACRDPQGTQRPGAPVNRGPRGGAAEVLEVML